MSRAYDESVFLILRSRAQRGVSKDEGPGYGPMVRDGAARLLTMRG
jgi:hypothetical protein